MGKVVLITGCSTGIGRDLAERLTKAGYSVAASARNIKSLDGLETAMQLSLDVTSQASIDEAVQAVVERFGRIDVLVNNAGYAVFGAIEETPEEKYTAMYDVNVFGVMRMVHAVAPVMRLQRSGRIINISSIGGRLAVPVHGAYSSTKFAVEALSDALRFELMPFGIEVVVIEPGGIRTKFADTVLRHATGVLANTESPYMSLYEQNKGVDASMRKNEPGPEAVSAAIQQAIEARKPKARYLPGVALSARLVLRTGKAVWFRVLKSMYKTWR